VFKGEAKKNRARKPSDHSNSWKKHHQSKACGARKWDTSREAKRERVGQERGEKYEKTDENCLGSTLKIDLPWEPQQETRGEISVTKKRRLGDFLVGPGEPVLACSAKRKRGRVDA